MSMSRIDLSRERLVVGGVAWVASSAVIILSVLTSAAQGPVPEVRAPPPRLEQDSVRADELYRGAVMMTDPYKQRAALIEVLQLNPNHPHAHLALAYSDLEEGSLDAAMQEFDKHLSVSHYSSRDDGFADIDFAMYLQARGLMAQAAVAYQGVLSAVRQESAFEQCFLFRRVNIQTFEEGSDLAKSVRRILPYCTDIDHRNRAVALLADGKKDEAMGELVAQVNENPFYQETYLIVDQISSDRAFKWGLVKRYFEVENDTEQRCRMYLSLHVAAYSRLDESFVGAIRAECQPQR